MLGEPKRFAPRTTQPTSQPKIFCWATLAFGCASPTYEPAYLPPFPFKHKSPGCSRRGGGKARKPDKDEVYFLYIELLVRRSATQLSFSWARPTLKNL